MNENAYHQWKGMGSFVSGLLRVAIAIFTVYGFMGLAVSAMPPPHTQEVYAVPEMVVSAGQDDAAVSAVPEGGLMAQVEQLPGLWVDEQGGPGGQADMRIRGGAFSGAGFSVSGLSLGNAQTEHFHGDVPLAASLFEEPVLRTGVDQALHTEGHLNGTVDLRLRPMAPRSGATAGWGMHESGWVRGDSAHSVKTTATGGRLGVAVFGGLERFNQVDACGNDHKSAQGGGQIQWIQQDVQADVVSGYREKDFGACGYYGTDPDYPADEKTRDVLVLAGVRRGTEDRGAELSAAYREFHDDYRLELPTSIYHNEHRTRTMSAQAGGRSRPADGLAAVWRLSADEEELTSESLGNHRRSHAALTLIPELRAGAWCFAAGARQEWFEREKPATLPQVAVRWQGADGQSLALSCSRTVRQPSYTELNYESPASLGNSGLPHQLSDTLELRWKMAHDLWSVEAGPFVRETRDTVDWVRPTPEATRWMAENIGTVRALGAEGRVQWMPHTDWKLRADGMLLTQSCDADIYASRYALDYPQVLLRVHAAWRMTRRMECAFDQAFRLQADNPMREHGDTQWLGALHLSVQLPGRENMQLVLTVENLWNDHFEPFPGQATAAGQRLYAAITARF